jgi:hypothetical protein
MSLFQHRRYIETAARKQRRWTLAQRSRKSDATQNDAQE